MIKFVQCVKCKPDISASEFRRFWQQYREKARAIIDELPAVRWSMSTTLKVEENLEIMVDRGTAEPFDGMLEIWFERALELNAALATEAAEEKLEQMQSFQDEFIDFGRSSFFFTVEEEG